MSTPQTESLERAIKAYEEILCRSNVAAIQWDLKESVMTHEEPKRAVYLAITQLCEYLNAWKGHRQDRAFLDDVTTKLEHIKRNMPELAYLAEYGIGFVERARGNHQQAFDAFERSAKANSSFYRAEIQKAAQKIYLDEPDEARRLLKAVAHLPDNNPAYKFTRWALARIDFGQGKYNDAIKLLDELTKEKADTWFHVAYKASALALEAEQLLEVLKDDFKISTIKDVEERESLNPSGNSRFVSETRELLHKGLKKAGLPEE